MIKTKLHLMKQSLPLQYLRRERIVRELESCCAFRGDELVNYLPPHIVLSEREQVRIAES
ncbi:hypothetical protein DD894_05930 [Staphylococcus pseudintermedius]|nr:hypothetical protein B5C02_07100 [Staphylococcus pseudintermedius]PWZ42782.1 hypothetical protein DD895_00610 [Staphylococcus pseudintermedius]PWZ60926.1 hypothetical protein DD889_09895 [Staphylococcus pseudintermedius]PXA15155.1 hypothetical protein DD894_05930 [Staphylococcus pseudintermedius]